MERSSLAIGGSPVTRSMMARRLWPMAPRPPTKLPTESGPLWRRTSIIGRASTCAPFRSTTPAIPHTATVWPMRLPASDGRIRCSGRSLSSPSGPSERRSTAVLRALFLVGYPADRAPSQRFRFEQWVRLLPPGRVEVHVEPFLEPDGYGVIYEHGHVARKVALVLGGALRRLES